MIWMGALFLVAWAIGMFTVPRAGWFIHLPLLVGGGAVLYGILRRRGAEL